MQLADTKREGGGERMMRNWNVLFNRAAKEAKNKHLHLVAS